MNFSKHWFFMELAVSPRDKNMLLSYIVISMLGITEMIIAVLGTLTLAHGSINVQGVIKFCQGFQFEGEGLVTSVKFPCV